MGTFEKESVIEQSMHLDSPSIDVPISREHLVHEQLAF